MKYFDYIFYRIHSYYHKKNDTPNFTAIMFLLILQCCLLFLITMTVNGFTGHAGSKDYFEKNQFLLLYWSIISGLLIVNIFRYAGKRKVAIYDSLFKVSHLNKKIPTWLIFIQPLIFIFLTILINMAIKAYR
jgi:phosphoglycerol transferase MdoB-like AlkP superfamily enzyme